MPRRLGWLVGLASITLLGCLHAPVLWSPDGHWLAYTMAARSEVEALSPGWIFDTGSSATLKTGWPEPTRRPSAVAYRLWATRVDTGVSVLLEESRSPLTSPSWSPDGKALVFGRVVPEENGRARFEVIVQDAPDRKRVLLKQSIAEFSPRFVDLPGLSLAWSPDGRHIAIPLFQQTLGLAIVRADNGRLLKVVEDAYLPSWSPVGSKLAFVRGTDTASLHCLDANFGPPQHLADIGQTSQAPVWSRDRRGLFVVTRRKALHGRDPLAFQSELMRVSVDGGKPDVYRFDVDAAERERDDQGVSFSFDPEGESLFFTDDGEGQASVVTWFHPRRRETRSKFNPIDFAVQIGSLAVSPNGKTLAFRAGPPGYFPAPGLWDLINNQFTPLVPDDAARVEWVVTLVQAGRFLLKGAPPATEAETGRILERATILPIPGELPSNSELVSRLRRIGRLGRPLCERPADAPPAEPAVAELLIEAKLFFDYLSGDFAAALASLEALESRTDSPDHRLRLLSARAQILLGQGEYQRAAQTIGYLNSIERKPPRRLEITEAGPVMTEEPSPQQGWPKYLAKRADELRKAPANGGQEEPLGQRFLDGPFRGMEGMPFGHNDAGDFRRDEVQLVPRNVDRPNVRDQRRRQIRVGPVRPVNPRGGPPPPPAPVAPIGRER